MVQPDLVKVISQLIEHDLKNGRKRARFCFFLGAGASLSSGAETFDQLKKSISGKYLEKVALTKRQVSNVSDSENLEEFFECLFSIFKDPVTRAAILRDSFPENEPSDGYLCLSLLCAIGAIDTLVSTNFDTYFERAAKTVGISDNLKILYSNTRYPTETIKAFQENHVLYFKIHGDKVGGIFNITWEELNNGKYPDAVSEVANQLMAERRLAFIGYSGSEQRLADLLSNEKELPFEEAFWIGPSSLEEDKPLFHPLKKNNLFQAKGWNEDLKFDPAMQRLISSLDSDFFIGKTNLFQPFENYKEDLLHQSRKTLSLHNYVGLENDIYVERSEIIDEVCLSLRENHQVVMLKGPSGYGKSCLMPALNTHISQALDVGECVVSLHIGGVLAPTLSLEELIAKSLKIERFSKPSHVLIQNDLVKKNAAIVFLIDAIDLCRSTIDEIKLLVRDIIKLHEDLKENKVDRIRIVLSCRDEIWHGITNPNNRYQIDYSQIYAIDVPKYNDRELELAFAKYTSHYKINTLFEGLPPETKSLLREPILLKLITESYKERSLPLNLQVHSVFENYIKSLFDKLTDYDVLPLLEEMAIKWLTPQIVRDGCRVFDLPTNLPQIGTLLDTALRSGIIRKTNKEGEEVYHFFHERILEMFMARFILRTHQNKFNQVIFNHEDLCNTLQQQSENKHIVNVLKLVLTDLKARSCLKECIANANTQTMAILKECILIVAQSEPRDFASFFLDWYLATKNESLKQALIKAAASNSHATERLWRILEMENNSGSKLSLSTTYFLVENIREDIAQDNLMISCADDLERNFPANGNELRQVSLITYLIARSHRRGFSHQKIDLLYKAFSSFLSRFYLPPKLLGGKKIETLINAYAEKYFFNLQIKDVEMFLNRSREERDAFAEIIKLLVEPKLFIKNNMAKDVLKFCHEDKYRVEKIILQPIFIGMALADFEYYKAAILSLLKNSEIVQQIDFCSGNVAYYSAVTGKFDHSLAYRTNEFSLKDQPDFFDFEQSYERLFNPIGTYGFIYPLFFPKQKIDLFSKYIEKYMKQDDTTKLLRMLHALRQTLSLVPEEGLLTLKPLIKTENTIVRKRLVRVLTEGYAVSPDQVGSFVWSNRQYFSEDEIQMILIDGEHNLSDHPITILEWGRVYAFLFSHVEDYYKWHHTLSQLNQCRSFDDLSQWVLSLFSGRQTQ